jgi:two-component system CheB/CheR fusion protein
VADAAVNPFPIVGVGASAGGLDALTQLCSALPPSPGLAVVIIQHLDPRHESRLPNLLQAQTPIPVAAATHGAKVEPDHIYVIQPNTNVAIADGVLSVTPRADDRQAHYPVDHFFRSLAAVQGPYAIGVVLSGTGSDGTLGLGEIKAAGGLTFAQDDQTAQYSGMPRRAVAGGVVDVVLPPREIAARLTTLVHEPYLGLGRNRPDADADADAQEFRRVLAALRKTSGVDFSQYRDTTIKRRTARRMLLRGLRSAAEYAQIVERDRGEAEALFRDVLINVTSFFRDPGMFEDLKREVFPAIVERDDTAAPIRMWVPGCSTGQEAYSLAISLLEFLDERGIVRTPQIFATDLGDATSLEKARIGRYPESIEADVSPERLRRFFVKEERGYRIHKSVRDMCVFARQNLTVDPPFSRVDLVTCRNVLIYMSPVLQERLLPVFHFALNSGGFMVLGLAETVGGFGDLFELVNRAHKIYRRKDVRRRPPLTFMTDEWLVGSPAVRALAGNPPVADFQREAERITMGHYAPPSVLVNDHLEIQHFRGRTAPFLEAPPGQPTTNILRMAKEGLFLELRTALAEAKARAAPVVREHLRTLDRGAEVEFTLRIVPVKPAGSSEMAFLVLFETAAPPWAPAPLAEPPDPTSAERDAEWLRAELASNKQYLQSILEDQDAKTQELRAAHEEVLSSNEELQSTNEELETTKEELQSANEELTTVNEQFESRNRELDTLTDDLSNFISSADLPMVTVGRDLGIRRLTPAAQRAFNLLPTDVGRSIEHIKFALDLDDIGTAIAGVITSLAPWQREVADRDGRWWLVRVQPFRTADDRIDGATVVAVDIDLVKRTHELMEERDYSRAIVQTVIDPLAVLDLDCRLSLANEAFYALLRVTPDRVEGRPLWDSLPEVWGEVGVRRALKAACGGHDPLVNFEIDRILPGQGRRTLVLNARPILRSGRATLLLLAVEDVTESRAAESLRIDAETLRQVDRRKDEFLGILAHELRNPLAPMRFAIELLLRADDMPPGTERPIQVLGRQVGHMVRIVDDLLDVSRVAQGKLELRKELVSLASIVTGAIELCRPVVDAARHTLTISLPVEPVMLCVDPVRLTQVLVNILNNASKFTPAGGHLWVIAEVVPDGRDHLDLLRIRVRDNGIGIPAESRAKIFDLFMQGDRSLERTRGGLGVGLTLARNLVSLHGGTIEVRSDGVDTGTGVVIELALDPALQPALPTVEPDPAPKAGRALRILVADDNEDGRTMLKLVLQQLGHEVATAVDGVEALAVNAAFHPEVAILDIGMPGMDGYQVAEELGRLRPAPLLIALSGLGQAEDKARAARAGFSRHFTKPVDVHALTRVLADVPAG